MSRHFPDWLKAYMSYTRDSESPSAFHFWTGVSTLAGALRRRVWIDMKKFQWTPNFYIILVGPPGVAAKSTSMSMGMSLLGKVPGVRFGPESMTWQKLAKSLSEATEFVPYNDANGTKMPPIAMSANTIMASELGMMLAPDDDKLMSFLIRMWEGQVDNFVHDTISGGNVVVENPWLNVIAATTPTWLKENFPPSMIGGGLTSRIVFVYGDKKRGLVAYPDEIIPSDEYMRLKQYLIEDLIKISQLAGKYELSPFARQWGHEWYREHNNPDLRPAHLSSERYSGYLARKQTHLHKFALVLAAAKRDKLVIEESDLKEAEALLSDNEQDMVKVFESIGLVDQRNHTAEIIAAVRFAGFMTANGLWARVMNSMTLKDFEEAVRSAMKAGILVTSSRGSQQGVTIAPGK